jgi:hypothetical protein
VIVVRHRVNTIEELRETPTNLGIELDIRSNEEGLYLSHNPFVPGCSFEEFLAEVNHQLLILNVKEEGLEDECERVLAKFNPRPFFFLDQSMPFLIRRGLNSRRNGAARISEFESLDTVLRISSFCEWVWWDFFFEPKIFEDVFSEIKDKGLKICLVSPELHDTRRTEEAQELIGQLSSLKLHPDAVCTKLVDLWNAV